MTGVDNSHDSGRSIPPEVAQAIEIFLTASGEEWTEMAQNGAMFVAASQRSPFFELTHDEKQLSISWGTNGPNRTLHVRDAGFGLYTAMSGAFSGVARGPMAAVGRMVVRAEKTLPGWLDRVLPDTADEEEE